MCTISCLSMYDRECLSPRFPEFFQTTPSPTIGTCVDTTRANYGTHERTSIKYSLNSRFIQHHSQSPTLVSRFIFRDCPQRGVCSDDKHQGVFEVFVGDSPWSGATPPTATLMCDPFWCRLRFRHHTYVRPQHFQHFYSNNKSRDPFWGRDTDL